MTCSAFLASLEFAVAMVRQGAGHLYLQKARNRLVVRRIVAGGSRMTLSHQKHRSTVGATVPYAISPILLGKCQ